MARKKTTTADSSPTVEVANDAATVSTDSTTVTEGENVDSVISTSASRRIRGAPLQSRIPDSLDVFGFVLSPGQFVLLQLLAALMLGVQGSFVFLAAIGAYALFQRVTSSSGQFGSSSTPSSGTSRGNWGGGGGGGRGGGGGGGSNIRGMADLPKCAPRGG